MTRIALQLSENLVTAVHQMVGAPEDINVFGDHTYAIFEMTSPIEFHVKLVTEDEIFEEAANDSDLEVISL